MTSNTMVFGATTRRTEKWRVYRIRTANSTYELEVQAEAAEGGRRCAVLTRVAPAPTSASFEDSAPRIGDQSLYALSPMEWMGKPLAVGTARTSEIQAVDFVKTATGPSRGTSVPSPQRTYVAPAPRPAEPPPWAPFPLGQIEMVEAAASVLKAVCHRHDLADAIAHDAHLMKRFKLALAECGLMLEAMERRCM